MIKLIEDYDYKELYGDYEDENYEEINSEKPSYYAVVSGVNSEILNDELVTEKEALDLLDNAFGYYFNRIDFENYTIFIKYYDGKEETDVKPSTSFIHLSNLVGKLEYTPLDANNRFRDRTLQQTLEGTESAWVCSIISVHKTYGTKKVQAFRVHKVIDAR